ncbi:hypothetical protein RM190_05015 [Paracoccus sp. CPCC 101403]|uniref:Uncharacterized protein n=2 Tax=Paracoccus broussonetiae TaxID=3075834 RepID=A0ABU3EAQ3_9RHOB|nr:hypothetical protein [Paracoccus sp. CPCC 101403]MDT1061210.1 hypothetical protein [Paracoccus sp. CPCC 101403]
MRIHEPHFPDDFALFIIWAVPPDAKQYPVAAGGFKAMQAAWEVIQGDYRWDELSFQHGARVLKTREPLERLPGQIR